MNSRAKPGPASESKDKNNNDALRTAGTKREPTISPLVINTSMPPSIQQPGVSKTTASKGFYSDVLSSGGSQIGAHPTRDSRKVGRSKTESGIDFSMAAKGTITPSATSSSINSVTNMSGVGVPMVSNQPKRSSVSTFEFDGGGSQDKVSDNNRKEERYGSKNIEMPEQLQSPSYKG